MFLIYTGYILTKSINLHYIIFLSVINQLKSLILKRFELNVRGMYVEVMYQALKTHLMAIRVNKLLVFKKKNQSQMVSFIRILWFYISSLTLLFQKLLILSSDQCIDDMPNVLYLHFHALLIKHGTRGSFSKISQ